jgi:hypothetical protein
LRLAVLGAIAAGLIIAAIGWLWLSDDVEVRRTGMATRAEVTDAFRGAGLPLERQFADDEGPVDATFTIVGKPLGSRTPLVVEIYRTITRARQRTSLIMKAAPETGLTLMVVRAGNVVAIQNGRDDELRGQIDAAMQGLHSDISTWTT